MRPSMTALRRKRHRHVFQGMAYHQSDPFVVGLIAAELLLAPATPQELTYLRIEKRDREFLLRTFNNSNPRIPQHLFLVEINVGESYREVSRIALLITHIGQFVLYRSRDLLARCRIQPRIVAELISSHLLW